MQTTTSSFGRAAVTRSRHSVSGLFIFLLIGMYALFSLLLVLIGVKVYRNVVQSTERNAELRTTIGYLSGRLRATDGVVELRQEGDYTVMCIANALGEADYETRIYYMDLDGDDHDGLYEEVVDKTEPFDPEMGELITGIGSFQMGQKGDMIELTLDTKEGEKYWMHLKLQPYQLAPKGGESA